MLAWKWAYAIAKKNQMGNTIISEHVSLILAPDMIVEPNVSIVIGRLFRGPIRIPEVGYYRQRPG
jgi:hypothetical protein